MSIGGIGSGHQAQLSQILSTLFSRLDGASGSGDGTTSTSSTDTTSSTASTSTSNDAVGRLSDEILALLVQLQQAGSGGGGCGSGCGGDAGSASGASSADATSQASQSPIQQLFSAIDTNGDGAISKSEFESYITQNGGTQQEADAIFSQLDPNGTGSVSENQLADAVKAGRHGHHHHHGGGQEIGQAADDLFSQIDTDGDGSITQQELENFVTQNGGTTAEADQDYAALDPNNTGSISKSDFSQAFQNLSLSNLVGAIQGGSDGTSGVSPLVKLVDAIASNASATTSTGSASASDLQPVSPRQEFRLNLFARLDTNGDGTLTQSEVEQAVTGAGGTTAAADALFSQLDPSGSGSVSQQQFVQNLWPQPGHFYNWFDGSSTGGSAQDAIAALLQNPTTTQTV